MASLSSGNDHIIYSDTITAAVTSNTGVTQAKQPLDVLPNQPEKIPAITFIKNVQSETGDSFITSNIRIETSNNDAYKNAMDQGIGLDGSRCTVSNTNDILCDK